MAESVCYIVLNMHVQEQRKGYEISTKDLDSGHTYRIYVLSFKYAKKIKDIIDKQCKANKLHYIIKIKPTIIDLRGINGK